MDPPVEVTFQADKVPANPFVDVTLDVVFAAPDGTETTVPAFWAGGDRWKARYASGVAGTHRYRATSTDAADAGLDRLDGEVAIEPYQGDSPLYRRGGLRVAADKRHFEHADGTPFLWLADTWWKNLCKRLTWEGFQELAADRHAKGFNAIQIVCGAYPDEAMMEARWENEGGKPYDATDFSVVNPAYFDYAYRRIEHLVASGLLPVIVGGWGRPQSGGSSTLQQVGLAGYQRHWRHLIARYGAYPTVWVVGGETLDRYGPWSELAAYVRETDPYHHPLCYHAPTHPREALQDNSMFDFDMLATGHHSDVPERTLEQLRSCMALSPERPALCGEACYEGHMQTSFADVQRHLFWSLMLSGAAGHTYGAAGVWHASVEGDPGITPVYDLTTWRQGMAYPGAAQLGLGRRLLERYPWSRFEHRSDWAEEGCFAAGIAGDVRIVYLPLREPYDWTGPKVTNLEPDVSWHVYYFDPATGRTVDQGIIAASDSAGPGADRASAAPIEYQAPVPSPQDWVLVFENSAHYEA